MTFIRFAVDFIQEKDRCRSATVFFYGSSSKADVYCSELFCIFRVRLSFKRDFLTFSQRFEAFHLDCGEVNKYVFAAVVVGKLEAFHEIGGVFADGVVETDDKNNK